MSHGNRSNPNKFYFPIKPDDEKGFKKPVSWLGGRELLSSLKGILMYSVFKGKIDPRSWMQPQVFPILSKTASESLWLEKINECLEWKKKRFAFWETFLADNPELWKDENGQLKEFWFDYISDTGDGQMGVYGVGCLCFADLWLTDGSENVGQAVEFNPPDPRNLDKGLLLPRGSFLFVGGDTAYHLSDYSTLHERFQTPFRWAFASVRKHMVKKYNLKPDAEQLNSDTKGRGVRRNKQNEITGVDDDWDGMLTKYADGNFSKDGDGKWDTEPLRPLFGVPANHDYYDDIDGFNRQFRRLCSPKSENTIESKQPPLRTPTFERCQEASYFALRLPFDWWLWGMDSETDKVDFRQQQFFAQIGKEEKPTKLIVATPEPTTVFGKKCLDEDKTAAAFGAVELEPVFRNDGLFSNGDLCRLDLSGDVHHYARYWGPNGNDPFVGRNYASVVAGGGGAFFHPSETLVGEINPMKIYPAPDVSRRAIADRIFDLVNIQQGGYVQTAGAVIAGLLFFLATVPPTVTDYLHKLMGQSLFSVTNKFPRVGEYISAAMNYVASLFPRNDKLNAFDLYSFYGLTIGLMLLATFLCLLRSNRLLHKLVKKMKEKRNKVESSDDETRKKAVELGKIYNLRPAVAYFLLAVLIYTSSLAFPLGQLFGRTLEKIHPVGQSLFLLLHFINAGLLVGLSVGYGGWLPLRFKFSRRFKAKDFVEDNWLNILPGDFGGKLNGIGLWIRRQMLKLSKVRSLKFLKKVVEFIELLSKNSIQNWPIWIFNLCVLFLIAAGIVLFGQQPLSYIAADLLFLILIIGGLGGLIYFAIGSGGVLYTGRKARVRFGAIGFFHALLQLLVPLLLVKSGSWIAVVITLGLGFFTNGFSIFAHIIGSVAEGRVAAAKRNLKKWRRQKLAIKNGLEISEDKKARLSWFDTFWLLITSNFGAWLMKRDRPKMLAAAWVVYGLLVLALPFIFRKGVFGARGVAEILRDWTNTLIGLLPENWTNWLLMDNQQYWLLIVLAVAVAVYLGYRMSRIWFSWYLAVSLGFNGHNNEAGGAARIEGFKQILRIKVEKDKLTVYAIGFDEAASDLKNLRPKLIDRFELHSK